MRIIGGVHRGRVIKVPKGLPVRPTTDFAKEGLFNILANRFEFDDSEVLDLFSGTGHISMEFGSRGARKVVAVDEHFKCVAFLRDMAEQLSLPVTTVKEDVFKFLAGNKSKYDLIFADPPYILENIPKLHELVFNNDLLKEGGWLVIEHGASTHLGQLSSFKEERKYGNVRFSFFHRKEKNKGPDDGHSSDLTTL